MVNKVSLSIDPSLFNEPFTPESLSNRKGHRVGFYRATRGKYVLTTEAAAGKRKLCTNLDKLARLMQQSNFELDFSQFTPEQARKFCTFAVRMQQAVSVHNLHLDVKKRRFYNRILLWLPIIRYLFRYLLAHAPQVDKVYQEAFYNAVKSHRFHIDMLSSNDLKELERVACRFFNQQKIAESKKAEIENELDFMKHILTQIPTPADFTPHIVTTAATTQTAQSRLTSSALPAFKIPPPPAVLIDRSRLKNEARDVDVAALRTYIQKFINELGLEIGALYTDQAFRLLSDREQREIQVKVNELVNNLESLHKTLERKTDVEALNGFRNKFNALRMQKIIYFKEFEEMIQDNFEEIDSPENLEINPFCPNSAEFADNVLPG
jgi:hypothetical protein